MRTVDFAPLYRSAIGFDRLAQMFDNMQRFDAQPSYPPYNIELVADNQYQITMAVAGFDRSELEIQTENDTLLITGRKKQAEQTRNYLHRGIGTRDFEHRFQLADHVRVTAAKLDNGLLHIDLIREIPEALKPRKIAIDGADLTLIQDQAA
jgi:molecular chaperone IbpA